jgi:hypothetical protein
MPRERRSREGIMGPGKLKGLPRHWDLYGMGKSIRTGRFPAFQIESRATVPQLSPSLRDLFEKSQFSHLEDFATLKNL